MSSWISPFIILVFSRLQEKAPMDRHTLRNILSIVVFSYDLVLTKEIIYKTSGSKVKLVCPIETIREITWTGPPEHEVYAVGTDLSPHVSTLVKIKETDTDKKSILIIYRLTEDISGEFRCTDNINARYFNLVIKKNPSDLAIVNAKGGKITTVEGREHNLECTVSSGKPGGNITWSTDGVVVATNGPSLVSYKLIPQRSDNGKLFICVAFNSEGERVLESSVILEVFYISKISFSPKQTLTVKENEHAQLICNNDGNDQNATTVWKRRRTIVQNSCVLNFQNVKRTDAGLYTCIVDTTVGVYEDNARLIVQYAPTIDIEYFPSTRTMKCIPSGVPESYVFKDWEHTTEYSDHIRFLAATKEGNNATLIIPKNVNNYRENGIYICRASNNISSPDGTFAMQKYNLNLPGKPHFVASSENIHYGIFMVATAIKVKFVSVPEYTSYAVFKNGTKLTFYNRNVKGNTKIIDTMYGRIVAVKGNILSFTIIPYTSEDFCSYTIEVKNAVGCTNYTINLRSASFPERPYIVRAVPKHTEIAVFWEPGFNGDFKQRFTIEYKKFGDTYWNNHTTNSPNSSVVGGLQPATKYLIRMFSSNIIGSSNRTEEVLIQTDIFANAEPILSGRSVVILSLVIIIAVLVVTGIGLYIRRLKQRYRERMEPAMTVQTPEWTFGESTHYTEIIEIENLHHTSQENDDSILPMTNRDEDVMSAEHTSTSSDNNRDSAEYIDDGYEKPYTPMVVSNQVKDEHVYLTAKKKSDYENTIPFENIACGHACKFLEADSLSDKTKAQDDHKNLNLNDDGNDLNVKYDGVPQTYTNPQVNKAEYINLSLNQ